MFGFGYQVEEIKITIAIADLKWLISSACLLRFRREVGVRFVYKSSHRDSICSNMFMLSS
jgi:hypothetical protein